MVENPVELGRGRSRASSADLLITELVNVRMRTEEMLERLETERVPEERGKGRNVTTANVRDIGALSAP